MGEGVRNSLYCKKGHLILLGSRAISSKVSLGKSEGLFLDNFGLVHIFSSSWVVFFQKEMQEEKLCSSVVLR